MGRAGSLELNRTVNAFLIEPVQGFFIVRGGYRLFCHFFSPACRDEQEDMMRGSPEPDSQVHDTLQLIQISSDGSLWTGICPPPVRPCPPAVPNPLTILRASCPAF